MGNILRFLIDYREAVIFVGMGGVIVVLLTMIIVQRIRMRRPEVPIEVPKVLRPPKPLDPTVRVHDLLVDYVQMVGSTLLQDRMTSPDVIVEKLLELAKIDPRSRVTYVCQAFRFARIHNLGTSYFTKCPRPVLEDAILADLGFLHDWGHDGNIIVEHGLRREQAQMVRSAEATPVA